MTLKHYIILLFAAISLTACGAYSFTGAKVNPDTKSFQVNYFQNNAALIEPGIDLDFTNALTDLLINQTNLDNVKSNGDLVFEGEIVEYRISPTTATSDDTAAQNRLTISVNVRFYNKQDEEAEFEKRFSFFYDYDGTAQLVGSLKTTAIDEIYDQITQDIFNAALAQW
ncbi:LptE family protein [Formosa sp. L2A11]|uniref:LptE family protein n=1 Tax=Formosa sp. L2A11 TaxID=2686363 RepID=UPI00131CE5B7|nr:LptE family protein [Formosa sp. L2A11]